MPSPRKPVREICVRIGLKAAVTKKSCDWRLNPKTEDFYKRDIGNLCRQYYNQSTDEIRASNDLRDSVSTLLAVFAPSIWPRLPGNERRRWLYRVGEGAGDVRYAKDLFYDNPEDYRFLLESIHELIVERVLRYRKDHLNDLPERALGRDVTWTPSERPRQRSSIPTSALSSAVCFATLRGREAVSLANDENEGSGLPDVERVALELVQHDNASKLRKIGVWLGDYSDDTLVVNGLSFSELQTKSSEGILDGTRERLQTEDVDFDDVPAENFMACAACHDYHNASSRSLAVERVCFMLNDNERRVWIYPCYYRGRKVFAILKSQQDSQNANASPLWSFWKVNGGYTTSEFLVPFPTRRTRAAQKAQRRSLALRNVSQILSSGMCAHTAEKAYVEDDRNLEGTGTAEIHSRSSIERREGSIDASELLRRAEAAIGRDADSDDEIAPKKAPRALKWHLSVSRRCRESISRSSASDAHREINGSELRRDSIHEKRYLEHDDHDIIPPPARRLRPSAQHGRTVSSPSLRQKTPPDPRMGSDDNDSEVKVMQVTTPVPDDVPDVVALGTGFCRVERVEPGQKADLVNQTSNDRALTSVIRSQPRISYQSQPSRIDLWLNVHGISGTNVVVVNSSMRVQEVFAIVSRKLSRKLGNQRMEALRIYPDHERRDEDALDVELNDHDGWETVLRRWHDVDGVTLQRYGRVEVKPSE